MRAPSRLAARLNYPALVPRDFHGRCLYGEGELVRILEFAVRSARDGGLPNMRSAVACYDWSWMLSRYDVLFDDSGGLNSRQ